VTCATPGWIFPRLDRHPQEIVKHLRAGRRQRTQRSGGRQAIDTGGAP
jgi:hypothetical protein